jgi:hypothetical protein
LIGGCSGIGDRLGEYQKGGGTEDGQEWRRNRRQSGVEAGGRRTKQDLTNQKEIERWADGIGDGRRQNKGQEIE